MLLLAAVLLIVVLVTNWRRPAPTTPLTFARVAIAREDIEPYSIIRPDQLTLSSDELPLAQAKQYYQNAEVLAGLMTTRFLKAGQRIGLQDAEPVENVRYVQDMGLEVVSFPAVFNEMVAGQVRPGHKINVYGYRRRSGQNDTGELLLVAGNVWVVDVRTSGGDPVVEGSAETATQSGGLLAAPSASAETGPGSVVAVAADPTVVQEIIRAFGSQGYSAYVTLAPAAERVVPVATPSPVPTAGSAATPLPNQDLPASDFELDLYMTKAHGSEVREYHFSQQSKTVWAAVFLRSTVPMGATDVELEVRQGRTEIIPRQRFTHPGTGWAWFPLQAAAGFPAHSEFVTTAYAGNRAMSINWWTNDAALPPTGGAD